MDVIFYLCSTQNAICITFIDSLHNSKSIWNAINQNPPNIEFKSFMNFCFPCLLPSSTSEMNLCFQVLRQQSLTMKLMSVEPFQRNLSLLTLTKIQMFIIAFTVTSSHDPKEVQCSIHHCRVVLSPLPYSRQSHPFFPYNLVYL